MNERTEVNLLRLYGGPDVSFGALSETYAEISFGETSDKRKKDGFNGDTTGNFQAFRIVIQG